MQYIDPEYLNSELKVKPGNRLHRLVALLFDTYYDDLTEARIAELEAAVETFRWMSANGKRVDRSPSLQAELDTLSRKPSRV